MARYRGSYKSKIYWSHFIFAVVISLLDTGFTHGYNLTCLRGIKKPLKAWLFSKGVEQLSTANTTNHLHQTAALHLSFFGFADSSFSVGAVIGSCLIVPCANKFGRKGGLLMTALISIFASLFGGYSKYFGTPFFLIVGRTLFGIKHGINSGLEPMYLTEISPQEIRGQVGMLYGILVSIGTITGVFIGAHVGSNLYWPLVLSLPVIPAILQLMLLPICPESPKYLCVIKNKERECKQALKWFRGDGYKEEEFDKFRIEYNQRQVVGEIYLGFILKNDILRNALVTTSILMASQQLCGVSMLLVYVQDHLMKSSTSRFSLGHVKNVFNISKTIAVIFVLLFLVEKVSRRKLYLVSFAGMSICCLLLCFLFISPNYYTRDGTIYSIAVIYLILYKTGTGALSWFAASEYFNTSAAPIGYTVGCASVWLSKFCLVWFALPLSKMLKGYTFLNYVVTNFALAYYTFARVPDTRNKSIKEVYRSIYFMNKKRID